MCTNYWDDYWRKVLLVTSQWRYNDDRNINVVFLLRYYFWGPFHFYLNTFVSIHVSKIAREVVKGSCSGNNQFTCKDIIIIIDNKSYGVYLLVRVSLDQNGINVHYWLIMMSSMHCHLSNDEINTPSVWFYLHATKHTCRNDNHMY